MEFARYDFMQIEELDFCSSSLHMRKAIKVMLARMKSGFSSAHAQFSVFSNQPKWRNGAFFRFENRPFSPSSPTRWISILFCSHFEFYPLIPMPMSRILIRWPNVIPGNFSGSVSFFYGASFKAVAIPWKSPGSKRACYQAVWNLNLKLKAMQLTSSESSIVYEWKKVTKKWRNIQTNSCRISIMISVLKTEIQG